MGQPEKRRQIEAAFELPDPHVDWNAISKLSIPPGLVLEFGVAGGTSFDLICKLFPDRLCFGFDWFWGLPIAWGGSGCGNHSTNGVAPQTQPNGCLIVGRIERTAPGFMQVAKQKVAVINFDADLYDPTKAALDAVTSYVQPGAIFVFDEICCEEKNRDHEARAFLEWSESVHWGIEFLGKTHEFGCAFRLQES